MEVVVLRLSHRPGRDKRITTHVCLVARAFGAEGVIYTGIKDEEMEKTLRKVANTWGGPFFVRYEKSWKNVVKEFKSNGFKIVHLTMYGLNLPTVLPKLKKFKKVLTIVGSEKVPKEVYEYADFNVAIGNQPHSEVAALAIFLDRMLDSKVFDNKFEDAKLKVIPTPKGKKILRVK